MACGGRLTIAVYTLRHGSPGEELTFDYASVTESEKEFRTAICLCGTRSCRGSFLTFAGSRAFQQVRHHAHHVSLSGTMLMCLERLKLLEFLVMRQVMTQRHSMLRRQALLVRSGLEPLTDADRARLQASIYYLRLE